MVDLTQGCEGFDFLGCHLRKRWSGRVWEQARRHAYYLHRWPSRRAMKQVRARLRQLTARSRCHTDLHDIITDVNRVLRGWGAYFRTGNAARRFQQVDNYVEQRLRTLLMQRTGTRPRPDQLRLWQRPFFERLGLHRLHGTIRYPGTA